MLANAQTLKCHSVRAGRALALMRTFPAVAVKRTTPRHSLSLLHTASPGERIRVASVASETSRTDTPGRGFLEHETGRSGMDDGQFGDHQVDTAYRRDWPAATLHDLRSSPGRMVHCAADLSVSLKISVRPPRRGRTSSSMSLCGLPTPITPPNISTAPSGIMAMESASATAFVMTPEPSRSLLPGRCGPHRAARNSRAV